MQIKGTIMLCPECNGDGYTEFNTHDMPLIRKYSFNVCAFKCWLCCGVGEYEPVFECLSCGNESKEFEITDDECPYCNSTDLKEKE
jgi:RNA polymerase subunit RPABC4/transcription elongation factor Spt4